MSKLFSYDERKLQTVVVSHPRLGTWDSSTVNSTFIFQKIEVSHSRLNTRLGFQSQGLTDTRHSAMLHENFKQLPFHAPKTSPFGYMETPQPSYQPSDFGTHHSSRSSTCLGLCNIAFTDI